MTPIYSYTLKLSAFLLRGRGGARFRGRWITVVGDYILHKMQTQSPKTHRMVGRPRIAIMGCILSFR